LYEYQPLTGREISLVWAVCRRYNADNKGAQSTAMTAAMSTFEGAVTPQKEQRHPCVNIYTRSMSFLKFSDYYIFGQSFIYFFNDSN
jgi:hypothetical protein